VREAVAAPEAAPAKASWGFTEGAEIVPGRFAVRLLGGGHRYEAYLAWDDELRALVVVKIVRPDLIDHPGVLAGMAGEARALDRLSHPVIVRAFDAVLEGERPHLVLELLDGPRLSTLLRTSVIAVEQVLTLGLQLCSAAHYLSARGIVHLDIKPRNVIMAGPPRLVDLSVALPFEELATITSPVGTDSYMAPEQCDPARFDELGPPADVWGIGVTLYSALAKERAFTASPEERFPQLTRMPAPLPREVPPALASLVFSTLEPRPPDRPTAAQFADALEPLVAALPRPRLGRLRPSDRGAHTGRADERTLSPLSRPSHRGREPSRGRRNRISEGGTHMARILIIALAAAFALGGIGAAFSNSRTSTDGEPIVLDTTARKDDGDAQVAGAATDDDDDDGDGTNGNDGTSGGNNTAAPAAAPRGDGDSTAGNDGTSGGKNTAAPAAAPRGDGDSTAGNDGTSGGDNTGVAKPAPAPAPVPAGDGDSTAGNDGTSGGDNTAPKAAPAPAPAPPPPADDSYAGGGGDSNSGGGDS